MKTRLLLLFLAVSSMAFADDYLENAKKVQSTTLIVVINNEGTPAYQKLKATVEKCWDYTPYKFIKKENMSIYMNNPKYTVLSFIGFTQDATSDASKPNLSVATFDLADHVDRFGGWSLYLMLGDAANKFQPKKKPGMAAYPVTNLHPVVSFSFPEEDQQIGSFDYLVVHAVKSILQQVKSDAKNMKVQEYSVRGTVEKDKTVIYYNDGKTQINKVLYVEQEMGDGASAKYTGAFGIPADKVKVVSRDEIAKAIESGQDANYTMKFNSTDPPLIYSAKDSRPIARLKE